MTEIHNDEIVINDILNIRDKLALLRYIECEETWNKYLIGFNDLITNHIILTDGIKDVKFQSNDIIIKAIPYNADRSICTTHCYLLTRKYQTISKQPYNKPVLLVNGDALIITFNIDLI